MFNIVGYSQACASDPVPELRHHRGGHLHRGPGQAQAGAGRDWEGRRGDGDQEEGRGQTVEGMRVFVMIDFLHISSCHSQAALGVELKEKQIGDVGKVYTEL